MNMLRAIAEIRNPVLDFFFETITHLGEETVFLVVALIGLANFSGYLLISSLIIVSFPTPLGPSIIIIFFFVVIVLLLFLLF